jgi:ketosteroid isomerase-like protein
MSSDNVKVMRDCYAAFGRGDIESIVSAVSEGVDWQIVGSEHDFPTLGRRKGPAGVREFFRKVDETLDFSEFSPGEFLDCGDKVVVLGHYAMTIKDTGRPISSDWVHVVTFRSGKIVDFREFMDTAQALKGSTT